MAERWTCERLAGLEASFQAAADPKRAAEMARYMKNRFEFHGIQAAHRRALQRQAFKGAPKPNEADVVRLTRACWRNEERELQYFGADYVREHIEVCGETCLVHLRFLITHKSWWDTVDVLAAHGVGGLARRHTSVADEMNTWVDSDNIWIARAALLYQLTFKSETDADQLFAFCRRRMQDQEFFIRKAIGWALREYSKTAPDVVRHFVQLNGTHLSGLSKREASKYLNRV